MNASLFFRAGRRAAVALFALAIAAGAQAQTAIKVGVGPFMSGFDTRLALAKGWFKEQGLDVELVTLTGGSQAVPQLLGGQLDFAQVDTIVAITARSHNVPVVITALNTVGSTDPARGYGNLVVPANSPIKSLKDLEGKNVAVNQINGSAWALARGTMDANGADSSKVHFLEVPPPQLMAALQQGRADAAVFGEPLVSVALSQGMRVLSNIEAVTVPKLPVFAYISSQKWAQAHPDAVRKFNAAIDKAHRALNSQPSYALEIAKSATQLPPKIIESIQYPTFGVSPLDPADLQKLEDFSVKYGLVDKDKLPKVEGLYFQAP